MVSCEISLLFSEGHDLVDNESPRRHIILLRIMIMLFRSPPPQHETQNETKHPTKWKIYDQDSLCKCLLHLEEYSAVRRFWIQGQSLCFSLASSLLPCPFIPCMCVSVCARARICVCLSVKVRSQSQVSLIPQEPSTPCLSLGSLALQCH